uniref:Secreted protein n=1 Tax=Phakopsora pachyrhizi TaxID=170000 RepID=A0A0S1MJN3_PHAPC
MGMMLCVQLTLWLVSTTIHHPLYRSTDSQANKHHQSTATPIFFWNLNLKQHCGVSTEDQSYVTP